MNTTTRKKELQLFKTEVEHRPAKRILAGMLQNGIISDSEMQKARKKIAEHYKPPFMEVEVVGRTMVESVGSVLPDKPAFRFHRYHRNAVYKQHNINAVFVM